MSRLSFACIADVQYASQRAREGRKDWRGALDRLRASLARVLQRESELSCVIQLGDIVEGYEGDESGSIADFEAVMGEFDDFAKASALTVIHVVGNHCTHVPRSKLLSAFGAEHFYGIEELTMSDESTKVQLIHLDSVSISPKGSSSTKNAALARQFIEAQGEDVDRSFFWNGAIDDEQIDFLNKVLGGCREQQEKVILAMHIPVTVAAGSPRHLLWNHVEVYNLIEEYADVVLAVLCGHWHGGGAWRSPKGVLHHTFKAILECEKETQVGVVTVARDESGAFSVEIDEE